MTGTVLTSVSLEQPLKPVASPAGNEDDGQKMSSTEGPDFGFRNGGVYAFGYRLDLFFVWYLGLNHLVAFYAILLLATGGITVKWQTLAFAFVLWPISGLGITAGAHRLWSHRSYDAHFITRVLLMVFNSIANQGAIWHWVRDHRTHHLHSDTDLDPHDSNRGIFYAHVGWLLIEKPKKVLEAGRKLDLQDLKQDSVVMFQKRLSPWWQLVWCFAFPTFVCVYCWQDTKFNGFMFAGVVRYVWVLNCTWCVNSIVHSDMLGQPSPYDATQPPSESRFVSFMAIGEGWHSWHHAFPFDYATSELGCLDQYNPTKAFIDLLAALGFVSNRKRGHRMWASRKQRMQEKAAAEGKTMVETLVGPPLWRVRHIKFQ